jgi:hypothetical protein
MDLAYAIFIEAEKYPNSIEQTKANIGAKPLEAL